MICQKQVQLLKISYLKYKIIKSYIFSYNQIGDIMGNLKNYIKQDQFKMTLKNKIIDIENYTDLGNLSEKEIVVFNNDNRITIIGENLTVRKLLNNEIMLTGKYSTIKFEGNNEQLFNNQSNW